MACDSVSPLSEEQCACVCVVWWGVKLSQLFASEVWSGLVWSVGFSAVELPAFICLSGRGV